MTKVKRFELEHEPFRILRQYLQLNQTYFIAGTNSLYVPSRQEKYLMLNRPDGTRITRLWTDAKGESYSMTPGEAARAELEKTFQGLRRVGWMAQQVKLFDWRWPMLYTGQHKGDGSYIDLKGAYHQLYSRMWLDTAFPCGYGSLYLGGIAHTLSDWKAARNGIIGICASRQITGVKGFKTFTLNSKNPYLAPGLWATIQGILNELAYVAERMGSVYIATDGYIFPNKRKADHFEEYLLDNGLKFRRKDGDYEIKNWGSYKVESKETQTFERSNTAGFRGFRSITLPDGHNPSKLTRWWSKSIHRYCREKWQGGVKEAWIGQ